jgi:hypothetical protein
LTVAGVFINIAGLEIKGINLWITTKI